MDRFNGISDELKREYGRKIYRLSLSSGCTCPNRDGRAGYGGCSFCSEGGSGDFAAPFLPVKEQLHIAKKRVIHKLKDYDERKKEQRFIAYFQSFTNTYGDVKRLEPLFLEAINDPETAILSIGTRPDCLEDDKLKMLQRLNAIKPVWVELGLQTIHEESARAINRGYTLQTFNEAYERLSALGIRVIVHVILGLPGESREDMRRTVRYLAGLNPHPYGVKLSLLHVLKGTRLAEEYERKSFHIMSMTEYAELVISCISLLPQDVTIHRMTGDGPRGLLIAPMWSTDKKRVLNEIAKRIRAMEENDGVLIREAEPEDARTLADIEAACFPAAEAADYETIKGRLRVYGKHFLLLSLNGETVSFIDGMVSNERDLSDIMYEDASLHDENGSWQMIFGVNTLPGHRRRGYASALIREMTARAKKEGRRGVVLTCKKEKLGFYSRLGFVNEGVSESTHGNVKWFQMRYSFNEE